ncbi:ATP-dependent DNA helicase Q-like 3 [Mizuhopecten yessoensis]|uniref:ATP-dependent DNA helicase Q-like 3 n=1 Tax=Mizuhopecten yessoensis TaxID=6573 RepID=A0A210PR19_MIZYE|nr:ATP-dependent DNA helicase Q-like 3 [Mizuhopecten yessoensis]
MAALGDFQSDFQMNLSAAKRALGIDFELKEKQLEALESLYNGNDTIVVVPTGFGKSLIFQLLPWLMQGKFKRADPMIVIIATPLNSIMHDQVQSLAKRGVSACYLDITGSSGNTYDYKR